VPAVNNSTTTPERRTSAWLSPSLMILTIAGGVLVVASAALHVSFAVTRLAGGKDSLAWVGLDLLLAVAPVAVAAILAIRYGWSPRTLRIIDISAISMVLVTTFFSVFGY
jgi:hypothetical protein